LPGWLAAASFSFTALDGKGDPPFLLVSASLGVSGARTRVEGSSSGAEAFTAVDARVGVTVGKTLWNALSPYAGVRAFGGPVFWRLAGEDRQGTDRHHYQVAFGLLASLPRGFDVFAEIAPLGERAVAVGAGYAF